MSRLLKHFKFISQPKSIINKRVLLQKRQQKQLQVLSQYINKKQTDSKLFDLSLYQLQNQSKNLNNKIFSTFTSQNITPWARSLRGLADINISCLLSKHGQKLSSLIPFSVKDHVKVQNFIQTAGFSHNIIPSQDSADIVKLLQKQHSVAYAQSNVPQGLLGIQCNNNVYGLSRNPYNKKFISGGSSGGQAIQVAIKASAFGVATDTAGSSRIPAAFCGIYGFKPTSGKKLSAKGRVGVYSKQGPILEQLPPSMGFMTRKAQDIRWLCEKTLGKCPQKNLYINGAWDNKKYQKLLKKKKFRIGYIINGQQMQTALGIKNAMKQVIQILKQDGHQVFQFNFPQLYKFKDFCFSMFKISGFMRSIYQRLDLQDSVRQTDLHIQHIKYGALGCLYRQLNSQTALQAKIYKIMRKQQTIPQLLKCINQKNFIKSLFLKKWNDQQLDLLLTPTMPFTAPLCYKTHHLINQLSFCCFQNILQMPAGNIPVRLVKSNETQYNDLRFYGSQVKSSIQQSQGLPIGVQLTSAHLQDQLCVAGIKRLENLLNQQNLGIGKAIKMPIIKN